MIKITGIEMEDFGRHKRISQKFDGNVIGLAGPNGKGKSTVIQALQLGLTGTIEHPDSLSAFIRQSGCDKPPKKARVKVDFVADGKRGSITRVITNNTNSRELVWEGLPDGVKSLTADKRVADTLFEILGVDKKAINSTVFIGQGELGKMFGKDVERREFYTRLLMLGHLDKIADVVDVYRKQIAESTQDLTAVKDAADTSYTQAQEFYELCQQELGTLTSPHDDIAIAMNLVGLFSRHAAAEQAFTAAETTLVGVRGASAASPEDQARAVTELQAWLDAANLQRRTHAALVSSSADAQAAVMKTADAARAYADLDKAEAALAAIPPETEDPRGQLTVLDGYLANFDAAVELETRLPGLWADVAKCKQAVEALDADAEKETQSQWEAADYLCKSLTIDLRLRRNLQRELSASATTACCTLCGSNNPDSGFLDKSILDLSEQLVSANASFSDSDYRRTQLIQARAAAENALACHTTELDRVSADLRRRKITASVVGTRSSVEAQKVSAESAVELFITSAADRKRLAGEVSTCRLAATSFVRPADGEYDLRALTAATAGALLADFVVDPTLDLQEAVTIKEMVDLRRNINAAAVARAAYTASVAQREVVEVELAKAIQLTEGHPTLRARLANDGILTAATVTRVAEEMRLEQTAYDHQVGKTTAAKGAMLQASAAVGELELKIAEQGERRTLAQDLCKLRDTFKPSGASLEYLDYKFGQIAVMASDYLAESQADFMVAASAEIPLAFEFVRLDRPDEVWMPQNRMSGGQKVRLAVATLRAIHALVMPNVGLLVLDEPTTHLDDDAVRSMADMLKKIGDEGTLQMVVCDHNPVLIDAFSDIIEIPE